MIYSEILKKGENLLKKSRIKNPNLDVELILSKVLNKKLDRKNFKKYKNLIFRRKKNEPIAHIFQNKEFWKYNFIVNGNVLIPRPETEIIVEEVLKLTSYNSSKFFLDVGTGSGCLILSIIKERPKSHGTAIDISKKAINTAINNAKMHHLENKIKFININIDKFRNNKYDFIVSNPPYINVINFKRLESNVKQFEPTVALKAGLDGLEIIKKLIFKSRKLLKLNGKLIFEIGEDQENKVKNLLMKNKFYINKVCRDLRSIPRVIISTKLF